MIVRCIRLTRPLTLVATQLGGSSMGFDLEGRSGSLRVSNSGWPEVLAIAEKYGWKRAGTNPPNPLNPPSELNGCQQGWEFNEEDCVRQDGRTTIFNEGARARP